MQQKRRGRPLKYGHILETLNDHQLYTASSIVNQAVTEGILPQPKGSKPISRKLRHTLVRMAKNHGFPKLGDGWLEVEGQTPMPAYLGLRWKAILYLIPGDEPEAPTDC